MFTCHEFFSRFKKESENQPAADGSHDHLRGWLNMQGHLAFLFALQLPSGSFSTVLPLQPSHWVFPTFPVSDLLSAQCVVPRMICTTSVNIATVITLPATSAHLPIWLDGLQAVRVVFAKLPTCVFRTRGKQKTSYFKISKSDCKKYLKTF